MNTTVVDQERVTREVEVAWTPPAGRLIPSGVAVAALIAAMLGMLTLAIVNWGTAASDVFNVWVHGVGKLWMPGAAGIGPYSGNETLSALVWLVSWSVLHPALKTKDMNLARWLVIFLIGVGIATTLIWPPVFERLAGH